MIELRELVKNYFTGKLVTKVLKGITLSIPEGQFLAITGPSGAGKSTLLYQISLLDKPTSGSILVDGKEICCFREEDATRYRLLNYGFVFQEYALYPELTACENVMLPALMMGNRDSESRAAAKETLNSLGLGKMIDKLPAQLSGGEQQRVSIARAIARKPRVLFADEPTANLDRERSLEVMKIFRELNTAGQTIVMVTHEQDFAQRADRIISLVDGQLVDDKTSTLR